MPLPSTSFTTIQQLVTYINTQFIPNGNEEITGDIGNSILNGLSNFIVSYTLNSSLVAIHSSAGPVAVSKPMNVFSVMPSSLSWPDNVQNEYYFTNATGFNIPLAGGYSYVDQYGVAQTIIAARTSVHIAKAINGSWIQMNNLGGGGGGSLPPQTSHQGQFLSTNGSSAMWADPNVSVTSDDFTNATDCPLIGLVFNKFSLFWADIPNFIYEDLNQWEYLPGGGFRILIPGFDSSLAMYRFELMLKGLNS